MDPVALPLTFLLPLRLERLKEATKGLLGNSGVKKAKESFRRDWLLPGTVI